jgi:hypothetical protein
VWYQQQHPTWRPRWLVSGALDRIRWQIALGERDGQHIEVVIDIETPNGGGGGAVMFVESRPEEDLAWGIAGPFSQDPRDDLNDRAALWSYRQVADDHSDRVRLRLIT